MPGLFGYTDNTGLSGGDSILTKMRDLMVYAGKCNSEPFFHGDGIHAGYCVPAFETIDMYTLERGGAACWFDGEIYNMDELANNGTISSGNIITAKELIISAYESGTLTDMLRKADGYFSAVIYDRNTRQIKLLADRFGFRQLFYAVCNGNFIWASECKVFPAVPDFKVDVNRQSVEDFMKYGILCDDRTWLDGVYLLDPAAILTFDARSGSLRKERYWSPDDIRPLAGKVNLTELYEEWGRLFKLSVAERTTYTDTVSTGLTLSGGLDSRAILAAMPEPPDGGKINAVTYGCYGCSDIRLAARAADVKGVVNHHVFPLEYDGWLKRAFLEIWATDGALVLSSQLGFKHFDAVSKLFGVCMNGIGGGTLQGGRALGSPLSLERGRTETGAPGLQMLRRRQCLPGFRLDESYFKVRMPFFDNSLYEFVMALPRDIRRKRFFYGKALLHNFPQYYKHIPWQQSGVPISLPRPLFEAGFFYNRVMSRAKRKLQSFGLPVYSSKLHFYIDEALRHKGNLALATSILTDKKSFYPEYISGEFTVNDVHRHTSAKIKRLCRILTFEIYMRQLNYGDFML